MKVSVDDVEEQRARLTQFGSRLAACTRLASSTAGGIPLTRPRNPPPLPLRHKNFCIVQVASREREALAESLQPERSTWHTFFCCFLSSSRSSCTLPHFGRFVFIEWLAKKQRKNVVASASPRLCVSFARLFASRSGLERVTHMRRALREPPNAKDSGRCFLVLVFSH
jgi:hypothetical protein